MPDLKSLADAGGLVIAMTLIVAILYGAVRGWWVPGWIYRQAIAERDLLITDVAALSSALARQVDVTQDGHKTIVTAVDDLTDEVRRWSPTLR